MAWKPTSVFLPEEPHRQRSLAGCGAQSHRIGHHHSNWAYTQLLLTIYEQFRVALLNPPNQSWDDSMTTTSSTIVSQGPPVYLSCMLSCLVVSDPAIPWTLACQPPLSVGFPRRECWGGLPFHFPGDLPNPRIEPTSPALQADSLLTEPPGNPLQYSCLENPMDRGAWQAAVPGVPKSQTWLSD